MVERKEQLSLLFQALNGFEYAMISFTSPLGLEDLSGVPGINVVFRNEDLVPLSKELRKLPNLSSLRISSRYTLSKSNLVFNTGESLRINFIHEFLHKSHIYLDRENFLSKRVLYNNGIFIADIESTFEYAILSNFLKRRGLSDKQFRYFNDYHILIQEDLLEYIYLKYGISCKRLFHLTDFKESYRDEIVKRIKSLPANSFPNNVNVRWHNFLGSIRQARMI